MKNKRNIIFVVVLIVAAICLLTLHSNNAPVLEDNVFIISQEATVEKDKNGNYIYESLDGKSLGTYQKIIPDNYREYQKNDCVIKLLKETDKQGHYTCTQNGYTYLLISSGKTKDSVYLESEAFEENEQELKIAYRLIFNKMPQEVDKEIYYLMQIPTDKQIKIQPLSYLTDEEKVNPFVKINYSIQDDGNNQDVLEEVVNDEE